MVLNVKYWKVNNPDGSYNAAWSETKLLESIAYLNIHFNQFNIFFKYRGYEVIESTPANLPRVERELINGIWQCVTYPDFDPNGYGFIDRCQYSQFFTWAQTEGYVDPTAFNIYVPWGSGFGGAASGYTRSIIKINNLATPSALHEIAHNLSIKHTRSSSEHVTREEFLDPPNNTIPNPDFNAKTAGDRVVDTAANPGFSHGGTYPYIDANCEYISGFEFDNTNPPTAYIPNHQDVINVMGDAYPCLTAEMTIGQGIRMRETIARTDIPVLEATKTDLASLYEPYRGEYYLAGPTQNPNDYPLFQPGFEYRFLECDCDCPQPTAYEDTSFSYTQNVVKLITKYENNYDIIYHPNHTAIGIKVEGEPVFWPQPRKCYDNNNKSPSSGKVTRFNDSVFNSNITITQKDSLGINQPTLIQDLPNGLYVIDKDYLDGSNEQTVVQKGNE